MNQDLKYAVAQFRAVKYGQEFTYGEGYGLSSYVKVSATLARPAYGQEYQRYGFKPDAVVKVQA